jgi:murein DD-endopeptidase MepM/ murein hydrolase activator NlpD
MMRLGPPAAILALGALAALAGCTRHGPPAPISYSGGSSSGGSSSASEAKRPPPALVPQGHRPHPDRVVVEKGDTLYTIAQRYDVPLRSILDANHLDPPFHLEPGTSLELPQERFHVVQPGDTLYAISRLYSVDVSSLATLNHLSEPYTLRSGQTLYLPAPVEPAVAEAPPTRSSSAGLPAQVPLPSPSAVATAPSPPAVAPPPSASATAPASSPDAVAAPPATPLLGEKKTAEAPPPPVGGKGFAWPLQGQIVEGFGEGPNGTHNDGINIAAQAGEPVRAAEAGTVAYAGNELRGYGNLLLIKHAGGYMTAYAHNGQLLVKRGDSVRRGQEIAKAGATGAVGAPQLHFEIRQGTRALDPMTLLPGLETSAR